jgi:hypothetical protein
MTNEYGANPFQTCVSNCTFPAHCRRKETYVHTATADLPTCSGDNEAASTLQCQDGVTHAARVSGLQTVAALMPAVREEETPRNYAVCIPTLARRDA